jgi:hypothetical protein
VELFVGEKCSDKFRLEFDFHVILEIFYMPDRRLYFPSEGRRAEDIFVLKKPTVSAGFEPANLGTKGQHATSKPPKPVSYTTLIPTVFKISQAITLQCCEQSSGVQTEVTCRTE